MLITEICFDELGFNATDILTNDVNATFTYKNHFAWNFEIIEKKKLKEM